MAKKKAAKKKAARKVAKKATRKKAAKKKAAKRSPRSKTSKLRIESQERRQKCLDLRRTGLTFEQISTELGISSQAAHKHVTEALREIAENQAETAEEIRSLEIERLDRLQNALWNMAMNGNEKAIDRIIKIMERRHKLLGLEIMAKQQVEHGIAGDAPASFTLHIERRGEGDE